MFSVLLPRAYPAFDYDVTLEGNLIGLLRVANLTST